MDLAAAHGWIVDELRAHRPIEVSMHAVIDRCTAARPHRDWAVLRDLEYGDVRGLVHWLAMPFQTEPHPRPLKALWFGLFNPILDGEESADMYVCGSERFTPDPASNSWSVAPDWLPRSRCAESHILRNIYRIAYSRNGLQNDAEYPLVLGYAVFAVRNLLATADAPLILGSSPSLGVAVGFDSGDFILLGRFGPCGLLDVTSEGPA